MSLRNSAVAGCVLLTAGCSGLSGQTPGTVTVTVTPSTTATSTTATSPTAPTFVPQTLQQAYQGMRDSVVRLSVADCDGYGSGSGFVVGDDLVVTAAHVVEGARLTRIVHGSTASKATLIGMDLAQDLALLRTDSDLAVPVLEFAVEPPDVGDAVATVGYTLGGPLSFHPGTINALNRKVVIEGRTASRLIEHDAAALPGDSGAPLVDTAGRVVGIHDAGIRDVSGQRLAVSAAVASPLVESWRDNAPDTSNRGECGITFDFEGREIDPTTMTQVQPEALHTLVLYQEGINNADYAAASAQFVKPPPVADFEKGSGSSELSGFRLGDMTDEGGKPVIWIEFVSRQDAGQGPKARPDETCTVWSQDYMFGKARGLWLIERTRVHKGVERNRPCP